MVYLNLVTITNLQIILLNQLIKKVFIVFPFQVIIKEMNRLGMLIDVSHASSSTVKDVINISEAPVIFSHSAARAICDIPRNIPDEILNLIVSEKSLIICLFFVLTH